MAFLIRRRSPRLAVVAGIGRSGTHFLGRFFDRDRRVDLRQETPETFGRLRDFATSAEIDESKYQDLVKEYSRLSYSKRLVVDKSHPSLWCVERLHDDLPHIKFIATMRSPLQVVNSMLNHEGVLHWYEVLDMSRPLPFLGIDESNVSGFAELPLYEKCVWKWISHARRIREFETKYPDLFRVYHFYDLITDARSCYLDMCAYLEIKPKKMGVEPKAASLTKFKKLSDEQIFRIRKLVISQGLGSELQDPA
jgi:hypothetical protein